MSAETFHNPYGTVENLWNQLKRTEKLMDGAMTDRLILGMAVAEALSCNTLDEAKAALRKRAEGETQGTSGEELETVSRIKYETTRDLYESMSNSLDTSFRVINVFRAALSRIQSDVNLKPHELRIVAKQAIEFIEAATLGEPKTGDPARDLFQKALKAHTLAMPVDIIMGIYDRIHALAPAPTGAREVDPPKPEFHPFGHQNDETDEAANALRAAMKRNHSIQILLGDNFRAHFAQPGYKLPPLAEEASPEDVENGITLLKGLLPTVQNAILEEIVRRIIAGAPRGTGEAG